MSNEQKEPRFFVDHLEIYDNDFTHDAKFTVTGDFKDANEKHFYLECICQKLNESTDTSQQQVEKPLPFCYECEEKDCQVSMDGYCNFIRRYKKSFEIERANKELSEVNTRNSLLVAENMEQSERIKELQQALANATVQINQLMGEYDSE